LDRDRDLDEPRAPPRQLLAQRLGLSCHGLAGGREDHLQRPAQGLAQLPPLESWMGYVRGDELAVNFIAYEWRAASPSC
jgi:hypothetical protein